MLYAYTHTHTHTHTYTHSLSHNLSLTLRLILCFFLSHVLTHTHVHRHTHIHTHKSFPNSYSLTSSLRGRELEPWGLNEVILTKELILPNQELIWGSGEKCHHEHPRHFARLWLLGEGCPC